MTQVVSVMCDVLVCVHVCVCFCERESIHTHASLEIRNRGDTKERQELFREVAFTSNYVVDLANLGCVNLDAPSCVPLPTGGAGPWTGGKGLCVASLCVLSNLVRIEQTFQY